jgi:D-lactate dehydrogenase (cytochrome)
MMPHPFSDAGNAVFPPSDASLETFQPRDEHALREILRSAYEKETPVTFVAALTGLTGSAVPLESGVRVDVTGLNTLPDRAGWERITPYLLRSDTNPLYALVAPGVALNTLNDALDALDLWYPPHPGEVRATIGGNVSTNASGPRTFAFGATRAYVQSLRIVLADGDTLTLQRGETFAVGRTYRLQTDTGHVLQGTLPAYVQPAVKNAAGLYVEPNMDLIDLFIGSEGILGAFTEIGVRLLPRRAIISEVLFFESVAEALACADTLRALKARAAEYPNPRGDGVVSLEFFDEGSLALVRDELRFANAIPVDAHAALEVELFTGDADTHVKVFGIAERLNCRGALPADLCSAFRYAVPRRVAELLKLRGQPKFGTDFAVPQTEFRELYAFYEEMDLEFGQQRSETPQVPRTAKWGHIGDSHLHCNFLCDDVTDQTLARAIYLKLVRKAVSLGGTISAEHGVGKKSLADETGRVHPYLWYQYGDAYRTIEAVKRVFDPKRILNRGNMGVG